MPNPRQIRPRRRLHLTNHLKSPHAQTLLTPRPTQSPIPPKGHQQRTPPPAAARRPPTRTNAMDASCLEQELVGHDTSLPVSPPSGCSVPRDPGPRHRHWLRRWAADTSGGGRAAAGGRRSWLCGTFGSPGGPLFPKIHLAEQPAFQPPDGRTHLGSRGSGLLFVAARQLRFAELGGVPTLVRWGALRYWPARWLALW